MTDISKLDKTLEQIVSAIFRQTDWHQLVTEVGSLGRYIAFQFGNDLCFSVIDGVSFMPARVGTDNLVAGIPIAGSAEAIIVEMLGEKDKPWTLTVERVELGECQDLLLSLTKSSNYGGCMPHAT